MMPGPLEKFLGVGGHRSCLLPLLSTTCSSGKKCSKAKLPQFSVIPVSPLGKPDPGSQDAMQTVLQFGICIHVPGICWSFAQIKKCKEQKNKRTHEVMVGTREDETVIPSAGAHMEVGGTIQDVRGSQQKLLPPLAAARAPSSPQKAPV